MGTESNISPVQTMQPLQMGAPSAPTVPQLYVNGFKAGCSTADVFVVIQHNGNDTAVLNMSFTLAKTLAEALDKVIEQLEQKSGQKIMTADTIARAIIPQAEQNVI